MALSAPILKLAIKARWISKLNTAIPGFSAIRDDIDTFLDVLAEGAAEATVEHITTLAQVNGIVVTVASVTGVTPGPGVSGPGVGSGSAPPGSII